MDAAKIRLSSEEMELLLRSDWILTKNAILKKVMQLFGTLQARQQDFMNKNSGLFPQEVGKIPAKISKGENYRGLPYMVLDQPRFFDRDHVFAIRTLFWWGHFFSSTLQLAGTYKSMYEEKLAGAFSLLQKHDFFICIHADPWQHHFEKNNFIPVSQLSGKEFEKIVLGGSFIKLSKKIGLEQWDESLEKLFSIFEAYTGFLE